MLDIMTLYDLDKIILHLYHVLCTVHLNWYFRRHIINTTQTPTVLELSIERFGNRHFLATTLTQFL